MRRSIRGITLWHTARAINVPWHHLHVQISIETCFDGFFRLTPRSIRPLMRQKNGGSCARGCSPRHLTMSLIWMWTGVVVRGYSCHGATDVKGLSPSVSPCRIVVRHSGTKMPLSRPNSAVRQYPASVSPSATCKRFGARPQQVHAPVVGLSDLLCE